MEYPVVNFEEDDAQVEITPLQESDSFIVPPYEQETPPLSQEAASTDAFYASAMVGEDPVNDFLKAQADLMQKGQSDLVDMAKERLGVEQDEDAKNIITGILGDTSISNEVKKSMLLTYSAGGYVNKDLRSKYISHQATQDNSITNDDRVAQENMVDSLMASVESMKSREKAEKQESFIDDVLDYGKATGSVVSKLAASSFAGLAGLYKLLKDRDSNKAANLVKEITPVIQEYGYNPTGAGVKAAEEKISKVLSYLSIPAEWVGQKTFNITGSPGAAVTAEIILDPINIVGISLLGKAKPKIPAGSPLDATRAANPPNAGVIAQTALTEETGKVAEALGTTKGAIIEEMVLPKLPDEVSVFNPDLAKKINDLDAKADYSFNLHKLDPNISDVEAHNKDMEAILAVTNEVGSPYYQQANSTFTSPGINVFEGKAVYGRNGDSPYVTREGVENAYNKLKESIDKLPEELRGTLTIVEKSDNISGIKSARGVDKPAEYLIEHTWRKEYPPLDDIVFGADAVKSTFGGININSLKHTPMGKWLFPTGVFDRKYEAGKERSIDRGLKQANDLTKEISKNISNTPYKRELNDLVLEADRIGKDYFSKGEISSKFPHLNSKAVDDLFETHVMWRRVAQYEHRILNNITRNKMLDDGVKSVYKDDGEFVSDVYEHIDPSELNTIKRIHDFSTGTPTDMPLYKVMDGKVYDDGGRQLVRLHQPIVGDGYRINYGLLNPTDNVDVLRPQPLPRITGWSPRRHVNNFYIDAIPRNLEIDGISIKDQLVLRNYQQTLAAAKTQYEASKIQETMRERFPDHDVVVRPERLESYGDIRDDYQTTAELYAHARKRGVGIENSTLQDPLQSLIRSAQSISHQNTLLAWEQATQKSFVKTYPEFLDKGQFPNKRADIKPLPRMSKEEAAKFQSAVAVYENYARFKEYGYTTDTAYKGALHKVSDALESIRIPGTLLRDLAKHEFPLVAIPKKAGSILYINTNVSRQWLIQPQQTLELFAINPATFNKSMFDLVSISTQLLGESPKVGYMGKVLQYFGKRLSGSDAVDNAKYLQAIKDSGIVDSIDSNVLVNGIFHDTHQLMTTPTEKVQAVLKGTVEVPSKIGRSLGYDPSELVNKIGIWLQMREQFVRLHPGEAWDTPAGKEWIAHEVNNYSGNMNKAGNLPYQTGMLSPLFQFSAIGHKMFMNLMQNSATSLSTAQRLRLSALRATMMGVKYGVPGGGLMYLYIDEHASPETKAKADIVKLGLSNYLVNTWINTYMPDPDGVQTDLAVSKSISPFGETGVPYGDFAFETLKLIDGKEVTNPRYPLFGVTNSLFDLSNKWETLWYHPDYSTKEKFEIGFREGISVSSGMNNWFKAQHMLGTGEKLNKLGNPNGMEYTVAEAYALAFGIQSNKEEWMYKQLETFTNNADNIKQTAEDIYKEISYLENMFNKDGTPVDKLRQMSNMLNMAVTNEGFTEDAKQKVMEEILSLSSRDNNPRTNLIRRWIMEGRQLSEDSYNKSLEVLRQDSSPEIQDLVKHLEEGNP